MNPLVTSVLTEIKVFGRRRSSRAGGKGEAEAAAVERRRRGRAVPLPAFGFGFGENIRLVTDLAHAVESALGWSPADQVFVRRVAWRNAATMDYRKKAR